MNRSWCGARVRRVLLFVGVAFAALPVGSALGAPSTTIGQTGAPLTTVLYPGGVERAETGSVMPGIGRVTSFQFRSGSCPKVDGSFDFQVLRPVGDDRYQVVGNTGTQSDPCDGALHSYPVFINVQAGDVLGVYVVTAWEGVIGVAAPESFAFQAQPSVGDTTDTLRPISFNDSSADESATFVPAPANGKNPPNGNGPSGNANGSPQGCGSGRGWKVGAQGRC
jgi:hypothetical protein